MEQLPLKGGAKGSSGLGLSSKHQYTKENVTPQQGRKKRVFWQKTWGRMGWKSGRFSANDTIVGGGSFPLAPARRASSPIVHFQYRAGLARPPPG
ncbi:MAG TPA: hypothetical protein VKF42_05945 [Chitinivibrionales bacterium]|jgi:hypothetical protein|nr:hypothetical protein [Chitinivibrionales bacterium]